MIYLAIGEAKNITGQLFTVGGDDVGLFCRMDIGYYHLVFIIGISGNNVRVIAVVFYNIARKIIYIVLPTSAVSYTGLFQWQYHPGFVARPSQALLSPAHVLPTCAAYWQIYR